MTSALGPGAVLGGKYRVLRPLGEGGMGAVFEAENLRTQKRVAVKWLQPALAHREEASARLVREAQAAARVRHRNVVDVYDVDREGEAVFLVMEYLEGEPLTAVLERRDLRMDQLIALLLPAMRGVAAAHKQGIVHRDIKPDNIFLSREDGVPEPVPKVLDFGVAKLTRRGVEDLSITASGSAVGTPLYMSYEQLAGTKDIDGRADVYAFGVILYEALTGRAPFEAETLSELCFKIATQPARPPKSLRDDIPAPLSDLVLRAMAKARSGRTPSVDALIRELEPFAAAESFLGSMTVPGTRVPPMAAAPDRQPATIRAAEMEATREHVPGGALQSPVASPRSTQPLRVPRRSLARLASGALGLSVIVGGLAALATRHAREATQVERVLDGDSAKPAARRQAPVITQSRPITSPEIVQLQPTHVAGSGHTERAVGGTRLAPPLAVDAQVSDSMQDAATPSPTRRARVRVRVSDDTQRATSGEPRTLGAGPVPGAPPEPATPISPRDFEFRVNQLPSADEF